MQNVGQQYITFMIKDVNVTTAELDQKRKNLERARDAQEKEVEYRTEKRWKIFSWASTLLIGSIAGAVAVKEIDLGCGGRVLLCFAVLVLAVYTILWLDFNRRLLRAALNNLKAIDEELRTYESVKIEKATQPFWLRIVSYGTTVILLAIVAIFMIFLPCLD